MHILSTEKNSVVKKRAQKLEINYIQGLSSKEKLIEFIGKANEKINFSDIAYMGNDINDIDCLKKSGLSIVVNDSHPEILKYGDYKTDFLMVDMVLLERYAI